MFFIVVGAEDHSTSSCERNVGPFYSREAAEAWVQRVIEEKLSEGYHGYYGAIYEMSHPEPFEHKLLSMLPAQVDEFFAEQKNPVY